MFAKLSSSPRAAANNQQGMRHALTLPNNLSCRIERPLSAKRLTLLGVILGMVFKSGVYLDLVDLVG